jgi:heptosyltransferase-3
MNSRPNGPIKEKGVLIVMPDKHMGNLIVSLPAISAICERFHNNTVIVDETYRDIIESLESVKSILTYPRRKIREGNYLIKAIIFFEFLKRLRKLKIELAVDLYGENLSAFLTFVSGAEIRVGRENNDLSWMYSKKVNLTRGRHKMYNYIEIAEESGIVSQFNMPILRLKDAWVEALTSKVYESGLKIGERIVCIHPGAGKIYKQWTVDGFVDIIDWLYNRGVQPVLIGAGRDRDFGDKILKKVSRKPIDLIDKLTIGELMVLLSKASIYLGNDSGPMHLAALIGTPVVAIFGPAREKRWSPLSEKVTVLRGQEPCEKCKGKDCELDFRCVKTLNPARVKEAIGRYLYEVQYKR